MLRFINIGIVILATTVQALAWSSGATRTETRIKHLEMALALDLFLADHPDSLESTEYWNQLYAKGLWTFGELGAVRDSWGNPLILRVPGRHGAYDIYSIGPNGTDEAGRCDDVSNWIGVNPGYHYKEGKAPGRIALAGSLILATGLFGYGAIWRKSLAYPLAGALLSIGLPLSYYWLTKAGPPQPLNYWILAAVGGAMAVWWGGLFIRTIATKPNKAVRRNTEHAPGEKGQIL